MTTSQAKMRLNNVVTATLNTELQDAFQKMVHKLNKALLALAAGNTTSYNYEMQKVNDLIQAIDAYIQRGLANQPQPGQTGQTQLSNLLDVYDDSIRNFFDHNPKYVAARSYKFLFDSFGFRMSTIDTDIKKFAKEITG